MIAAILFTGAALASSRTDPATALRGLDPVHLCEGAEVAGDPELTATHGRFAYEFADEASRARFLAEPERFGIQWGGACARMGPLSGAGSPDRWAVHAGRIYLFASDGCREGFLSAPERFLPRPTAPPTITPRAREAGAAWIERALEAHGGVAAIDGAPALRLTFEGAQGEWTQELELVLGRAGLLRRGSRWTPPEPDTEVSETTWFLAPEACVEEDGERFAVTSPAQVADLRRIAQREPITLLWARRDPGFLALHLGPGELGGVAVEDVLVQCAGLTTTLHLEPSSARILGLSWRGRATDGVTRDVVETFTAWRELEGLRLPVARSARVDGEDEPSICVAWQGLELLPAFPPVASEGRDR